MISLYRFVFNSLSINSDRRQQAYDIEHITSVMYSNGRVKRMNKAYKFRLYPNEAQRNKIQNTIHCARFIYNKMLSDKIEYYQRTGKKLKNTPAQYKKEFEWLKEVDSLALANAQINLQLAYEHFFRNQGAGFPRFKTKKHSKKRYTTNCVNGNIVIQDDHIKLPKIGFVRMKQHRMIPEGYKLKSVTITLSASGKYYASVLFEYKEEIEEVVPESVIGLTYSDKELYIDNSGEHCLYPSYCRATAEKLRREQRRLAKMKQGSKNRAKQRVRAAKLHEKLANQRRDFLHKQSRQIVNAYDCVCVKSPSGAAGYDADWGMFIIFLKYKLTDAGKRMIWGDSSLSSEMLYVRQAV